MSMPNSPTQFIFRVSDSIRVRVRVRVGINFEFRVGLLLSEGSYQVQECVCVFGFEL